MKCETSPMREKKSTTVICNLVTGLKILTGVRTLSDSTTDWGGGHLDGIGVKESGDEWTFVCLTSTSWTRSIGVFSKGTLTPSHLYWPPSPRCYQALHMRWFSIVHLRPAATPLSHQRTSYIHQTTRASLEEPGVPCTLRSVSPFVAEPNHHYIFMVPF